IIAGALFARRRCLTFDLVDGLLVRFLLWSVGASLFATNHWLAQRALSVSISGAVVFWGARSIAPVSYRSILIAAAIAAVCAAVFSLAQAYGIDSEYFSTNRAPGGTFGNRNFVAHMAVIGLPSLVWCTVTARKPFGALVGSLGGALVAAALVLSRSRAAWLAVAASVGVGPGNWPVEYVRFAPSGDRSLTDDGMTANPWPSSDWVASVSERGFVPALALLGTFVILFFSALRRWSELENPDAVLAQCVLA